MPEWKLTGLSDEWTDGAIRLSLHQNSICNGISVNIPAVATESILQLFGAELPFGGEQAATTRTTINRCGSSLRVTFLENNSCPVNYQISWEVILTDDGHIGLDSIVSARTETLDAPARFRRWSRIDAADVLVPATFQDEKNANWNCIAVSDRVAPVTTAIPCVLFRLPDRDFSYLEMIHPADHRSSEIQREAESGDVLLGHSLFSCSIEKGVILRARVRGVLLPRKGDELKAAMCFTEFSNADPPLNR